MKTKTLLFIMAALFLSGTIWGQIIHVPGDQPTIQAGINAATDGDTVLVAENTYYENIRFMGKAITVASEYILDSDSSHIVNTIIDGSQAADPDSAATVMFINGEDTTSIINGFTITGGSGAFSMTWQLRGGGGVFAWNSGCRILNNIITENHINGNRTAGGGIYCDQDNADYYAVISGNYIGYNTVTSSGEFASSGGIEICISCSISNNIIEHNDCTNTSGFAAGGGILAEANPGWNTIVDITGNTIRYNSVEGDEEGAYAGGLYCYSGVASQIKDNIITGNTVVSQADGRGGGLMLYAPASDVVIRNNVITENTVSAQTFAVGGGIILRNSPSPVELSNNIIENNHLEGIDGAYGGGIRIVDMSEMVNIYENEISANTMDAGTSVWGGGIGAYNADNINITNNIIEHNSGSAGSQQAGGAGVNLLRCRKSYITDNEINENSLSAGTYAWGAGIFIDKAKSTVYIQNNSLNDNASEGIGRGGGISIYSDTDAASYFITANEITGNFSDSWGGGFCGRNTYNLFMGNNIFKGNESDHSGGAIMFYKSSKESGRDDLHPVIANNTFISNNATSFGGAIYTGYDNEVPVIFNSIFWNNTAGSGMDFYNSSSIEMLVYHNDIDTTLIYTPWTGSGNIFCDPEMNSDSIHLDYPSQCVNAGMASLTVGDTTYVCPDTDIDGDVRPFDWTLPDIGVDEAQWYYVSVDESASGNSSLTIFPNPFTTTTTIEYELQQPATVQITVYNHFGEQVSVLAENRQPKGKHQLNWNTDNLPAGVYYCVLKTDKGTRTTKMIKMK